ncbi:AAA family ATPase [Paenibacillus sp. CF384]|uniref:AAA family ATPase n=1 Tax=Paenibacillus sp. CF384 TaxID=1884382 RepID=UPI00089B720C|nr:AAA family ATPase [Paenibacillus sp. CF384]SDW55847.1 AAA domain-containing protein [Paenibacillus sp. CF384]
MKLQGLHVEGFGKLSDLHCKFDAPVTIVYGHNEAGKSTMLGFVRAMLFGFANKGNPAERQEPVYGGRHGGRLFFENSAGHAYVLERYSSAAGKVNIRRLEPEGSSGSNGVETLTQSMWERMFLGGVNERLFRELFAISLSELQAIGMLEGDELGKQLYHAGWNGGSAIAKTEKLLNTQLDQLYRPRGSTQQMNKLMKTLDEIDAQLRQSEDSIAVFNELSSSLAELEGDQSYVEEQLPTVRDREALLTRAVHLRQRWIDRLALQKEEDAYGDAPRLVVDARAKTEAIAAELIRLHGERHLNRELAQRLSQQLAVLSFDDQLIASEHEIEALLLSAEHIAASRQSAAELSAEMREHEETARRMIHRISPNWTATELRSFPNGVADREQVRVFRAALQDSSKVHGHAEAELRAASQQVKEAAAQLSEVDGDNGVLARGNSVGIELLPDSPEALRLAARQFEEAWHELELAKLRAAHDATSTLQLSADEQQRSREGQSAQLRVGSGAYWAAVAITAAGAAVLVVVGEPVAAAVAGVAAVALAAPGVLRFGRPSDRAAHGRAGGRGRAGRRRVQEEASFGRSDTSDALLADAEKRVVAAVQQLVREPAGILAALLARGQHEAPAMQQAELSAAWRQSAAARDGRALDAIGGAAASTAAQVLARLRAAIDARQDELRLRAGTAERRGELARRHARLRAQEDAALAAVDHAAEAAAAIAARWREWLAACDLPASLTPEAAAETFDLAEQALLRLQSYDRAAGKAARLQAEVAAFEDAALQLSAAFPAAVNRAHGDAAAAVRMLHAEASRHAAASSRAEELQARLAELEQQAAQLAKLTLDLEAKQRQWFDSARVNNELEWLDALQRSERLAVIEAERYRLDAELTAGLTSGQREQLETWYSMSDGNQLTQMQEEAKRELGQLEQRRSELIEQSGRKRQQLEQLLQSSGRSRLIMEREQATAALEQLIERYAVGAISMTMIRRTKRIMEEQRQPGVLREASRIMARLSHGSYKRISIPEGEQTISLESKDGRLVESKRLSRGTAEQLYLAMRLALADEAAASMELPLLLDDPLVNFDLTRQRAAVEVLGELAERRQIVLFTCHDHMRDLIRTILPQAELIHLA